MAAFRYSRTSQPQSPAGIDWGNPIARGLVFCQSPDGQELVYKRKPTFVNAPGSGVNRYGKFYSFGGTKSITYPQFGAELPVSGPATMLWIQEPRSAAAYSTIAQFRPNSSTQPFLIYQSASDAGYAFVAGLQSQSNPSYSAAVGVSVNNKVDLFALRTKTSLSSVTAADWSLFRNGISLTSSGVQAFSSSTATATAIGLLNGTSDPFEGLIGNFCIWNRALSDAEIKSLSENPWQIFDPQSRQMWVPASVSIYRPSSDVLTTGWTGTPDNTDLYKNIDEVTASDTDYITSPTITGGESTIMGLSGSLVAGTWDVRYRANFTGTSADVRITLLDGSNVSQGVSSWQTVTSSYADYTAQITTTGTATRVKVEVQ